MTIQDAVEIYSNSKSSKQQRTLAANLLAEAYIAEIEEDRVSGMCFPGCRSERMLCALMIDVLRLQPDWGEFDFLSVFCLAVDPKNWSAVLGDDSMRKNLNKHLPELKISPHVKISFHEFWSWLRLIRDGGRVDEARNSLPGIPGELAHLAVYAVRLYRERMTAMCDDPKGGAK